VSAAAPRPEDALERLAAILRDEDTEISAHIRGPGEAPELGLIAAAGPGTAAAPGEYALIVETVREGYLLHYGEPRVVTGAGDDLSLLAGDYLYALGLERLAALGDLGSVRELSDLISACAAAHAGGDAEGAEERWRRAVAAIAAGSPVTEGEHSGR
jgi:hypothetical protein